MDKILHLLVGMALAAAPLEKPETALMLAITMGVAKEIYDSRHRNKHTSDAKDALATIAGGVIVFAYRVEF
jgi:hypothetical protein